jgi:hypothetical protein
MALWSVIEDTPGVYRFQAIQTARQRLEVRLQAKAPDQAAAIWETVKQRVRAFLVAQGLTNVSVERSADPPAPNPLNGKFRHVWAEIRDTEANSQEHSVEYVIA